MFRAFLWLLAVALLLLAVFLPNPVTISLTVAALVVAWLSGLYRPPDNHIGVVYRLGRLRYLVGPEQWAWVIPLVDQIRSPIDCRPRQVAVEISGLLTLDRVPIALELLGLYQVDPRLAEDRFRLRALYTTEQKWEEIFQNALCGVAGEVAGGFLLEQLLDPAGRRDFGQMLSESLACHICQLGIHVDRRDGVMVSGLRPMDLTWFRLQPLLEGIRQGGAEADEALRALMLELAAAAGRNGGTYQTLVVPGGDSTATRLRRGMGTAALGTKESRADSEAASAADVSPSILLGSSSDTWRR